LSKSDFSLHPNSVYNPSSNPCSDSLQVSGLRKLGWVLPSSA